MKYRILSLVTILYSLAHGEPQSEVVISGRSIRNINGVTLSSLGGVRILSNQTSYLFTVDEVPKGFLASWGVTDEQLTQNKIEADKRALAESEKKMAQEKRKEEARKIEERKQFIAANTRTYFVIQVLDAGILANSSVWVSRSDSLGSVGGGGGGVRVPRRGLDVFLLTGYSGTNLTEASIVSGAFVADGTYSYTTADGTKETVSKLKYLKE